MTLFFESPILFDIEKKAGNVIIKYYELMEISQGGPEVGRVSFDGKMLEGLYGGPLLFRNNHVFIPAYFKKLFLGTGFKLAKININTAEIEYLTDIKYMIFLEKIEEKRIYFFEDINRTIYRYCDI